MVEIPDEFQITTLGGGVRNSFPFCILFDSIQSSSVTFNLSYIKTAREGINSNISSLSLLNFQLFPEVNFLYLLVDCNYTRKYMYNCVFLTKVDRLQDFMQRLFDRLRGTRYHFCEQVFH